MAIAPREFLEFPPEKAETARIEWPHAFARREFSAEHNLNHSHATYGDWIEKLKWVCRMLKIEYKIV